MDRPGGRVPKRWRGFPRRSSDRDAGLPRADAQRLNQNIPSFMMEFGSSKRVHAADQWTQTPECQALPLPASPLTRKHSFRRSTRRSYQPSVRQIRGGVQAALRVTLTLRRLTSCNGRLYWANALRVHASRPLLPRHLSGLSDAVNPSSRCFRKSNGPRVGLEAKPFHVWSEPFCTL